MLFVVVSDFLGFVGRTTKCPTATLDFSDNLSDFGVPQIFLHHTTEHLVSGSI